MTEELGRPVRYQRQSLDELRSTLLGYGLNEAFVEGVVDMKRAKDQGLDSGVGRSPQAACCSPSTSVHTTSLTGWKRLLLDLPSGEPGQDQGDDDDGAVEGL